MIRKTMLYILFFLLSASLVFADVEVAFYMSYGEMSYRVEVKRADNKTWEFIKTGQKLNPTDILRVPPDVILRVKIEDNFIRIRQGQEGYVNNLIIEANSRQKREHGSEQSPETRILETDLDASKNKDIDNKEKKGKNIREPLELDFLRTFATLDESTLKEILEETEAPKDNEYPFRNKGYAENLFKTLVKEISLREKPESDDKLKSPKEIWKNKTADEIEFAILYFALLKGLKIKVDFRQNNKGEIFILFDSSRSEKQMKQITANRNLYRLEDSHVWLPLRISPLPKPHNFVVSWYRGMTFKSE